MEKKANNSNLKIFFIKLISIVVSVIIVINLIFNLILAERLEKIDKILSISNTQNRAAIRDKIRNELQKGLEKDEILNKEDKIILLKVYKKIKKELSEIDQQK